MIPVYHVWMLLRAARTMDTVVTTLAAISRGVMGRLSVKTNQGHFGRGWNVRQCVEHQGKGTLSTQPARASTDDQKGDRRMPS